MGFTGITQQVDRCRLTTSCPHSTDRISSVSIDLINRRCSSQGELTGPLHLTFILNIVYK